MRLALVVALVSAASPALAQPKTFEFFAGIEDGCRLTPEHEAFLKSLPDWDVTTEKWITSRLVLPPKLAKMFGKPVVKDERLSEAGQITVPIKGTFKGLRLISYWHGSGKGSGIHAYGLKFAAPLHTVQKVLGEAVSRGQARLRKENEDEPLEPLTELREDEGRTLLICDFST